MCANIGPSAWPIFPPGCHYFLTFLTASNLLSLPSAALLSLFTLEKPDFFVGAFAPGFVVFFAAAAAPRLCWPVDDAALLPHVQASSDSPDTLAVDVDAVVRCMVVNICTAFGLKPGQAMPPI